MNKTIRNTVIVLAALLLVLLAIAETQAVAEQNASPLMTRGDDLAKAFRSPPRESQVWCYWWWLNGAASKEGITRDFEEMKKQGIGGALLFDAGEAGGETPRGEPFMSPAWRELFKHAVREADRCGIILGVNLCSGWNAGGPWVTPELAANNIVAAATTVKGPGKADVALPQPEKVRGFYCDVAVLACRVAEDDSPQPKLTASSSFQNYLPALAQDGSADTRWISNGDKPGMGPSTQKPEYLQFDYEQDFPAAGLYLAPYTDCGPKEIEVQCSDDGKNYRSVQRATIAPRKEVTLPFDEVRAKHFRVAFLSAHPFRGKENWNVQVAEIALLTRAERDRPALRHKLGWDRSRTVDVTKFVDDRGRLTWDVPAGRWNVLRIGCTLHGNMTKCVGSGPAGLETDTMSAEAMDAHFAETGAKLIADAGPLAGKTLQYFHIDSWELGQPTWTPKLREEFRRRRGYDPLLWLPAVLRQTVDNAEETKKFLQDYRRTAADLVAENYYGRLEELSVKGGLRGTHPESGGPFFTHWIDALQCMGRTAIPMGEFWRRDNEPDGDISHDHNPSLKQAASAAHIYGKPLCQAEAFTSMNACDWTAEPWIFKDIGDEAFCEGLTRNVLCFWVHQSKLDAKPGFQWAHVGTHFDCNITWWPMADGWLTYLARCQHMLRQGLFVADFAYLQDEEIPGFLSKRPEQQPARPAGFDYDVMNAEVLLTRTSVKESRLVLPNGMSYGYLVLPHKANAVISPATLKRINELAEAGATVVGPKALAGSVPRMREGALDAVVRSDGLAPDIEFREVSKGARFDWIHRRSADAEIYFVANLARVAATAEVVFRTAGKQPELWNAVTGETRDLTEWRIENDRTALPLVFAPRQSWFIVFRKPTRATSSAGPANFPKIRTVTEIAGPWQVSFDPKWGGPKQVVFEKLDDWTARPEEGIKYYSGTATYKRTFALPQSAIRSPKSRLYLDLGAVKNVARVRLNGRDLGVVWTAPWRVEITGAVRPGDNDLEIDVANLWPNRLIGDANLRKEKRLTTTNVRTYDTMASGTYGCKVCASRKKAGRPAALLPSGLLGPVRLVAHE
jgi:hypothetical protein